jgi:uncharacterized membrane protein
MGRTEPGWKDGLIPIFFFRLIRPSLFMEGNMTTSALVAAGLILFSLNVQLPAGGAAWEQVVLRWAHFVAGFTWLGIGYFFNLCRTPLQKAIEGPNMTKAVSLLMPNALGWARWAAVVTWLAGFRYFMILAQADAANNGSPALAWRWIGIWLVCWLIAFAIIFALLRPTQGFLNNGWVLGVLIGFVCAATAWLQLSLLSNPAASNRTLCISVGGGLGTIMFLGMWGLLWRANKKLIAAATANVQHGTPMPPETPVLLRQAFLSGRLLLWLSFPMLFFMAASAHFPFLSGK